MTSNESLTFHSRRKRCKGSFIISRFVCKAFFFLSFLSKIQDSLFVLLVVCVCYPPSVMFKKDSTGFLRRKKKLQLALKCQIYGLLFILAPAFRSFAHNSLTFGFLDLSELAHWQYASTCSDKQIKNFTLKKKKKKKKNNNKKYYKT